LSTKYKFDPNPYAAHRKLIKLIGKDKKVLDVGCATGYISKHLSQNGCTVIGIEMNPELALEARKYCEQMIVADVETLKRLDYPKGFFDVICFGDILEHLKNPQVVLGSLRKYLKDDGYIVVSIPNVANWGIRFHLLFGKFDYQDEGILEKTHLCFFTLRTARKMIEDAGFQISVLDVTPGLEDFLLWKFMITLPARAVEKVFRIRFHDHIAYCVACSFKRLFAHQFLIQAKRVAR